MSTAEDDFPFPEAPTNVVPIRDDGIPSWMDEIPPHGIEREKPEPLVLIDPATWQGTDAPDRRWKVKDYIPDNQATLLTGKGAAGKSLVSQLQCTCIALGLPFLGLETVQTVAIYITCEDDAEELHRRQKAICEGLGVSLESLSGKLHLLSLQGEMNNELATFDREGRMAISPRYEQLVEAGETTGAGFMVLDNTAHVFTGNENDRHQVAAFINLCNRLAIAIGGAVVIVGHPNKAGDSYSGSTAWENQVRSRLFMEIPTNEDGEPDDPDLRVMRREKVNYAQRGGELLFRWFKGTFVLPDVVPEGERRTVSDVAQDTAENARFMECLEKATSANRAVSHVNGINYAPRIFAAMPQAKRMREDSLKKAMERLISIGEIELEAPLWRKQNRHWQTGIKAKTCANPSSQVIENIAPTPAPTPASEVRQPPSQVIENIAPELRQTALRQPPIDKSISADGAADDLDFGDPPAWMDEAPPLEPTWRDNPILNGRLEE